MRESPIHFKKESLLAERILVGVRSDSEHPPE